MIVKQAIFCLCKSCSNPLLEPTSTKQWEWSFLLNETTGAFDGARTHNWLISTDHESDALPTPPFYFKIHLYLRILSYQYLLHPSLKHLSEFSLLVLDLLKPAIKLRMEFKNLQLCKQEQRNVKQENGSNSYSNWFSVCQSVAVFEWTLYLKTFNIKFATTSFIFETVE